MAVCIGNEKNVGSILEGFKNEVVTAGYSDCHMRPFSGAFGGGLQTLAVSAACGAGKTKCIVQYVASRPSDCHIMVVHRKSLGRKLCNDLHGAGLQPVLYSESKGQLSLRSGTILIVQLESLIRVELPFPAGVDTSFILDEYNSIERQLVSANSLSLVHTFKTVMLNATRVIALDAYLGAGHLLSLSKYRGDARVHWEENTYQRSEAQGHLFRLIRGVQAGIDEIMQRVEKGERLMVPCSSRTLAHTLETLVKERFKRQGKCILVYDAFTDQEEKDKHFRDVNSHWLKYDLIIYTSTLEVGVSFEQQDHFSAVIALFDSRYMAVEQALQMIHRSRPTKEMVICADAEIGGELELQDGLLKDTLSSIEKEGNRQHKHVESLWEELEWAKDRLSASLSPGAYAISFANVRQHAELSRRKFFPLFRYYIQRYGGVIQETDSYAPLDATTKSAKQTVAQQFAVDIANATPLSLLSLEEAQTMNKGPKTRVEKNMFTRFQIEKDYELGSGGVELTAEFVAEYGQEHTRRAFRNCRDLQRALEASSGASWDHVMATLNRMAVEQSGKAMETFDLEVSGRVGSGLQVGMQDAFTLQKWGTDVGHHDLVREALQFLLNDTSFTPATFNRNFSTKDIAAAINARQVTVEMKCGKSRCTLRSVDKKVLSRFRALLSKARANSFLKKQQFSFRWQEHIKADTYVEVKDVLGLAKSLLHHVYGTEVVCASSFYEGELKVDVYTLRRHKAMEQGGIQSNWGDGGLCGKRASELGVCDTEQGKQKQGKSQASPFHLAWAQQHLREAGHRIAFQTAACKCGKRLLTTPNGEVSFRERDHPDYSQIFDVSVQDELGNRFALLMDTGNQVAEESRATENGLLPVSLKAADVFALIGAAIGPETVVLCNSTSASVYGDGWSCGCCHSKKRKD
eukprot:3941525-Rhodomonas_salina.1